jgi:hypothetical protein
MPAFGTKCPSSCKRLKATNPADDRPSDRSDGSLPHGFEFNEAELASGTFTATGDLTLDYKERSAIFADFTGVSDSRRADIWGARDTRSY